MLLILIDLDHVLLSEIITVLPYILLKSFNKYNVTWRAYDLFAVYFIPQTLNLFADYLKVAASFIAKADFSFAYANPK